MACAALIRKDESHFNLAHRLVSVVVEKNNLDFDAVWLLVSTNTIQQLQKRFRKLKRANNPLSGIKKPRTSFSFYTKNQRVKIAEKNPEASFGELSKLVSKSWASLSDKERRVYKKMEEEDRVRYAKEKEEVMAKLAENPPPAVVTDSSTTTTEESTEVAPLKKSKNSTSSKSKTSKSTKEKSTKTKTTTTTTTSTSEGTSKKTVRPYNVFAKEQRALLKKENPDMPLKDVNSKLGTMWKALSTEEKSKYSTVNA